MAVISIFIFSWVAGAYLLEVMTEHLTEILKFSQFVIYYILFRFIIGLIWVLPYTKEPFYSNNRFSIVIDKRFDAILLGKYRKSHIFYAIYFLTFVFLPNILTFLIMTLLYFVACFKIEFKSIVQPQTQPDMA